MSARRFLRRLALTVSSLAASACVEEVSVGLSPGPVALPSELDAGNDGPQPPEAGFDAGRGDAGAREAGASRDAGRDASALGDARVADAGRLVDAGKDAAIGPRDAGGHDAAVDGSAPDAGLAACLPEDCVIIAGIVGICPGGQPVQCTRLAATATCEWLCPDVEVIRMGDR